MSGGISFDADAFEVSSELELWLGVDVEDEVLGCSRAGPCWTQENLECGTLLRLKQEIPSTRSRSVAVLESMERTTERFLSPTAIEVKCAIATNPFKFRE